MDKNNNVYTILINNSYIDSSWHMVEEFASLVIDAGYMPVLSLSQKVETPHPSTYVGKGFIEKVNEAIALISRENPDYFGKIIIATGFDLTGTQRANLKKMLGVEVIDRTFVILKIFHSKEAKLQVDIASLTWSKNHLINAEGAFSQVTSGGGLHNKGSGEKKIVLDRRHIDNLITAKKKELEQIKKARKNSRTKRNNSGVYKMAIVGYTNAGKSALLNSFIKFTGGNKEVTSDDNLFVTLETSTREISKYGYMKLLMTDTVGFVRNLPTILVEAFKSTLEEIKEADLLIHVVDFSDEDYLKQIEVTNSILEEIGVNDIPVVYLYNKYDLAKNSHNKLLNENEMYTSLINQDDVEDIYRFVCEYISKDWLEVKINIPYDIDFNQFSADNYVISSLKNKNGFDCTVRINPRTKYKYDYLLAKND